MWKTILSSFGFLTLPVLVLFTHWTSRPSPSLPILVLFFLPLFWLVCLGGGLLGLGIGALIDVTRAVPTKAKPESLA
jgi:hypothetical protein